MGPRNGLREGHERDPHEKQQDHDAHGSER